MKKIFYLFLICMIIGNFILTTTSTQAEDIILSNTTLSNVYEEQELKITQTIYNKSTSCFITVASNSDIEITTITPIINKVKIETPSGGSVEKMVPYTTSNTDLITPTDVKRKKELSHYNSLQIFTTFYNSNITTTSTEEYRQSIIISTTANTKKITNTTKKTTKKTTAASKAQYSASYFKKMGVIKWGGWSWTWYSQRVLPGPGLHIPGRHVGPNGYIMDKNNRICLASSTLAKGTVVKTPFGAEGCVYDSGCPKNVLDVYVDW